MLLAELAGFTYTCNLLLSKVRESNDVSFLLQSFELLEIDVALCEHGHFYLVQLEDKNSTFPSTTSDNSTFLFNEATSVIELDLHALLHNLVDWDPILRYC